MIFHTLILLIVLLILSAFFSGSEAALFSLSKLEKRRLQTQHPVIWKTVTKLLDRPRRTLITILIGNMVVNTAASALVTLVAVRTFGPESVGWVIAAFTLILVMTGELTPKVLTVRYNERFTLISAIPIDLLARVLLPARWLVRRIADRFLSFLIHEKRKDQDLVSETELKALVRIGEEEGALRAEEGKMIERLIGLGSRMVREIMTPRPDLVAFDIQEGRDKFIQLIQQFHFSYLPVYEKSLDHLLGVISTQEVMLDTQNRLRELIVPPDYVPETKLADELLQEFQTQGKHFAICVDEYGAVAGVVTLEDILEEVFGEFYDEYASVDPLIQSLGGGRFIVHGKTPLHQLNEALRVSLESQTSETLNGWLLERMGRIPKPEEHIHFEHLEFRIRETHRQRILKVEILKKS